MLLTAQEKSRQLSRSDRAGRRWGVVCCDGWSSPICDALWLMEVELVSVQVPAQIQVDAYAVAAGAGLGRRKNPPGWQQQAGGFLD